jgi:hypothetical protein
LSNVTFEEGDPVVFGDAEVFSGGPDIVIGAKI